jgi:hypothetical protein
MMTSQKVHLLRYAQASLASGAFCEAITYDK